MMEKPRRRILNIIRRMAERQEFYTNMSPRISNAEIKEMWALGFAIQKEHTHGAQSGPIAVYPLFPDKFKERAKQFLESINSKSKRSLHD